MINLVEMIAGEDEVEQSPCFWGNIVKRHACYCHSDESPYRKCGKWSHGEPYEECEYFKATPIEIKSKSL